MALTDLTKNLITKRTCFCEFNKFHIIESPRVDDFNSIQFLVYDKRCAAPDKGENKPNGTTPSRHGYPKGLPTLLVHHIGYADCRCDFHEVWSDASIQASYTFSGYNMSE